jgi:DNA-binding MarR family transcriptional regulator
MNEDIDRAFGFLIHDISTMLRSRFYGVAKEAGLNGDQWLLISNLSRRNNISQRELARLADMTPLAVTRQLDILEEQKWVKRKDDKNDRRSKIVKLTRKAEQLMDIYNRSRLEARAEALAGLEPGQVDELNELLYRVRENLREKAEDKSG